VNGGLTADQLPWQAEGADGHFTASRRLRSEPEEIRRGDAGREDLLAFGCELLDGRGIGKAPAEGRLAGAIVDAFAEAFEESFAREA
jgi:hypothetical protein